MAAACFWRVVFRAFRHAYGFHEFCRGDYSALVSLCIQGDLFHTDGGVAGLVPHGTLLENPVFADMNGGLVRCGFLRMKLVVHFCCGGDIASGIPQFLCGSRPKLVHR